MSTTTINLQPITPPAFVMRELPISLRSIEVACEHLYLNERFNPLFLIVSKADHDALLQESAQLRSLNIESKGPDQHIIEFRVLRILVNQITGTLMDMFVSERIPHGTVVFGRYDL